MARTCTWICNDPSKLPLLVFPHRSNRFKLEEGLVKQSRRQKFQKTFLEAVDKAPTNRKSMFCRVWVLLCQVLPALPKDRVA